MRFRISLSAIVAVLLILCCVAGLAGTISSVTVTPGNLTVKTTGGATKFGVVGSSGNTTVAGTLGVTGNFAVNTNKFAVTASSGNTSIAGTLAVTGASTIPLIPIVSETTASRTVSSTDYGKLIVCSYAGTTTITLPNPSSGIVGATLLVAQSVDQTLTIVGGSTADNNQIVADGVATSDNVSFSTSSHKIGAMARITCISATKWLITNASGCAMTVEAAD